MRTIQRDGVGLAVHEHGDGPTVLLVHGFPDSSRLWRHQVPALEAAGRRVVTFDLRGLGESDRPDDVGAYRVMESVEDALAVLDATGAERAAVVGHDFGAVVAWLLAARHPERVTRLVAMSVAHPASLAQRTIEAREKAWYQLLFQFEGVAEELLVRDDWRLLREWTREDGDIEDYVRDLSRPGALTAGLNWYRANLHPRAELQPRPPVPPVQAPTLGLWSSRDNYLTEDRMRRSREHVEAAWRYERIDGASHWMQLDEPDRVNELLVEFLR